MSIEQKGLQGEEQKRFQEMLPPDDYEPDWKKQFKAMDRVTKTRRRGEQLVFFGAGFLIAAFVPGLFIAKAVVLATILVLVNVCVVVAIKSHLYARDIDKKLDEGVRIEKPEAEEKAKA